MLQCAVAWNCLVDCGSICPDTLNNHDPFGSCPFPGPYSKKQGAGLLSSQAPKLTSHFAGLQGLCLTQKRGLALLSWGTTSVLVSSFLLAFLSFQFRGIFSTPDPGYSLELSPKICLSGS